MLSHALRAAAGNQAPAPTTDPNFNQVTLLLHGDGTNGAQNNTFLDSSTNNFTVTRNGNTTQGTNTPFSLPNGQWSNYFSSGALLQSSNSIGNFGTGDFTVEFWINAFSSAQAIMVDFRGPSGAGATQLRIQFDNANTIVAGWVSDLQLVATSTATLNVWTHVAVVRSGTTATLYINGISQASITDSTSLTDSGLVVGAYQGNSFYLGAYLSNIRVVKGTAVYTSNFTPPTTALTAITNTSLLTCQSNAFKDNSSNNYAFTVNGNPLVQPFSPFLPTAAYSTSVNGGSMYFDGAGDYLSVANATQFDFPNDNFTIEFWLNPTSWYGSVVSKDGSFIIYRNNSSSTTKMGVRFNNDSSLDFFSTDDVPVGVWSYWALVRNGNVFTWYLNGVSSGSFTNSLTVVTNSNPVTVGYTTTFNISLTGYITDLRIIKGVAQYTANFTPPTAPLTAITNTSLLLNGTNAGIFDNAIKNNLETAANTQVSTSVKKYGTGSMYFDGTSDYLVTSQAGPNFNYGTGNFTVEFWVYPLSGPVSEYNPTFYTNHADNNWNTGTSGLRIHHGNLIFDAPFQQINFSTAISNNVWTHVAVVRNGNTITAYINGVNSGSVTRTATVGSDTDRPALSTSDTVGTGGREFMEGYIDDLRITKGIARYTANFTPPTAAFFNQ